ncbi:hypothetical protein FNF27_04045 [Cafeteria roenbergensis]|uniref:Uncharacterized protein n=2 Tax=Cafeteria roenbergensis TaxID=33653 RepID=A0A5A8ECG8_CAFRO|nr:hypothetical protein FNF27_04045 [Cafeteria roenbergensis]
MAAVAPPKLPEVDAHRASALIAELYLRELAGRLLLRRQALASAGIEGQDLASAVREAAAEAESGAVESCGFPADVVMDSLRRFSACREVVVAAQRVARLCDASTPAPKADSEDLQTLVNIMAETKRLFLEEVEALPEGCFPSKEQAMGQLAALVDSKTAEACASVGMDPSGMNAAMTRFSHTAEVVAALKDVTEAIAAQASRLSAGGGQGGGPGAGATGGGGGGATAARSVLAAHASGMIQMAVMLGRQVSSSGAAGSAAGALFDAARAANEDDMKAHVISQTCGTEEAFRAAVEELEGGGEGDQQFVMKALRAVDLGWELAKRMLVDRCSPEAAIAAMGISPSDLDLS